MSYGPHPLQTYHLFKDSHPRIVVFIHGGAWVDPKQTHEDFRSMALAVPATAYGVNYRLSPEVKYPAHLCDVSSAIAAIMANHVGSELFLVGHSVGATLIMQILQEGKIPVDGVVYIDGIYDVSDLLAEYPEYNYFVEAAHDEIPEEKPFSRKPRSLVIQSKQDELLSERQSLAFCKRLEREGVDFVYRGGMWGKHDEVIERGEVIQGVVDFLIVNEVNDQ